MKIDGVEKRVLVFIVAYNAEKTITSVLDRIPAELRAGNAEVLIIDDSSKDRTFQTGLQREDWQGDLKVVILRTPSNQGYGGNQKLGYRYAIDQGFDVVALVHGDGQYAPEKLPDLLEPLVRGEADAVFGSRMLERGAALRGGMPLYKFVGNKILTRFQNYVLGSDLSEFHSGYRLYSTNALGQIPFERNSNDFHFDTDIIIQLVMRKLRILELPIPTYYGDEICHVDGLKYAWDIFRTMLRAKFHKMDLLYDRKFDVEPVEGTYDLKLGYASSHTFAISAVKPGARVLDIGCGRGFVASEFAKTAKAVTGLDQYVPDEVPGAQIRYVRADLNSPLPVQVSQFDQVFLLDIIEHLHDPEVFMENLRTQAGGQATEVVLTTGNVAFFVTRLMLFLGNFNYGRRGILDRTHTRLFTWNSLKELFQQSGFRILEMRGIPAPFPKAVGRGWLGTALLGISTGLLHLAPRLFSYQIFVRAVPQPTVDFLLHQTIEASEELRKTYFSAEE